MDKDKNRTSRPTEVLMT